MKLGAFIAVAIVCSSPLAAHASPTVVDQAAARSRVGDHKGAIDLFRKAYEIESNPTLLVSIAHEFRLSGNAREALAYFCSYMYVDAAGPLADEASLNARSISAKLGNPTQSDHDACSTRPPASRKVAKPTVDTLGIAAVPAPPPRITKREVVGLSLLGGTMASLGMSLWEARKLKEYREDLELNEPGTNISALEDRRDSAALRQKLWLVAGGATLITGGILYVTGRNDRKRAERAYVAPSLTKNSGGLVLGGRF